MKSLFNYCVLKLPESMKSTPDQDKRWSILDLRQDHFLLAESIRSGAVVIGAYATFQEASRMYDENVLPFWMGALR
jgi:hypothetical protein